SSEKIRAELLVVIHENQGLLRAPSHWLGYDHLSLPLGIEKVPVGFEFLLVQQRGVIVEIIKRRTAEREDIFVFVVAVDVLSLPPFRLIKNFGENQAGLDRIEEPCFEKPGLGRADAADKNIGKILSRSSFRHDSCDPFRSTHAHFDQLDVGKTFLKLLEHKLLAGKGVKDNSAFLFPRAQNLLPFFTPVGCSPDRKSDHEKKETTEDGYERLHSIRVI